MEILRRFLVQLPNVFLVLFQGFELCNETEDIQFVLLRRADERLLSIEVER